MAVLTRKELWNSRVSLGALDVTLALHGTTLYLLSFAILSILMFAHPAFFSTDDYYHARISEEIIRQGRLALDFPWLPLTILDAERFVDHHLLFHMYIALPTYWFGMAGAKLATVSIGAGIVLAAWVMLRGMGVRYPAIWALGLFAVSSTFWFRTLMIRTQGFSTLLLLLALAAMFQKRYRWLVVLGFLYVWLYNGFVLMLAFAGLYAAAVYITEGRIEWRPMAYCALGLALGVVINPYFPKNVAFVLDHLGAKLNLEGANTPLGAEWSAMDTRALTTVAKGALLALVVGLVRPSLGGKRDAVEVTLLLASLITLLMTFNAMRFLEYFPVFPILFCAAAWGREDWVFDFRSLLRYEIVGRFERAVLALQRTSHLLMPLALIAVLTYFSVDTLHYTYRLAVNSRDPEEFAGPAAWLEENTAPGTLVMSLGFNDFSRLFFYNQQNTYVSGLDPTYLSLVDPDLWRTYQAMGEGRIEQPAETIAATFGAQYIVTGNRSSFSERAALDPNLQRVFADRYHEVWKVSDEFFAAHRRVG